MKVGYARVSTHDQNLDLQLDALKNAGCGKVFQESASGKSMDRPVLAEALAYLREWDTLVIWKLDRLGRNLSGMVELAKDLSARSVHLQSVTDSFDTATAAGRFFFNVMASFAEMERDQLRERTRAGLAAARDRWRMGGRRSKVTAEDLATARELKALGHSERSIAKRLKIPHVTLHSNLRRTNTITQ